MRAIFLAAALAATTTTACTAQFVVDPESAAPHQVIAAGRISNGLNELKEALELPATQDKFHMAFTLLLFQLKLGRKELICVPAGWDASTVPNNAADGWLERDWSNLVEIPADMTANPCVLGAVMLHEALHVVQSMPLQPHGEIDPIDEAVTEIPAHVLGMSFLDGKLVDPTLDAAVRSLMERYLTTWTESAMEFINTLRQGA